MIVKILIIIVVPLVIGITVFLLASDKMKKADTILLTFIVIILFMSVGLYACYYIIPAIIGMFITRILMIIYETL